jgi:hypothetical protein
MTGLFREVLQKTLSLFRMLAKGRSPLIITTRSLIAMMRLETRISFVAIASLLFLSIVYASDSSTLEKAVAVTILKANIPGRTVLVRNLNGTQETIPFVAGVSVTSIAEAAMNQRLSGGMGYQFLIVCSFKSAHKMITAFHYTGKDEWKTMRGNLQKVNTANRTVLLKPLDGSDLTLHVGQNCAMNTKTGVKMFKTWLPLETWESTEVVAYCMDVNQGKIVHLLESP